MAKAHTRALEGASLLIAPQALKGSLDAAQVAGAIAEGVRRVAPAANLTLIPLADGGEGLTRALVSATGGRYHQATVTGPLGAPVDAQWGELGPRATAGPYRTTATGPVAVIEMAAAAGLPLIAPPRRDPLRATTRGVGELILRALDSGCGAIILGLGGSATNDGGAGMAQALGARLLDPHSADLEPGGAALARLHRIDGSSLDPRLAHVQITAACDVRNPLCGSDGASAVYGPQKGATPQQVVELDAALAHYAAIIARDLGRAVADDPGAGAAGGLGAGLLAFTPARLVPGAHLVMEALGVARALRRAALVITAEGRLDAQTAYGKVVGELAAAALQAGAPVVALAGSIALSADELTALGITVALPLADGPLTLEASIAGAPRLLADAAERALRLISLGATIERFRASGAHEAHEAPAPAGSAPPPAAAPADHPQ